jgi:glucose-6-phosphate isomerase
MIKLNLENLAKVEAKHGLSESEISAKSILIPDYLKAIEARKLGFYQVIDDAGVVEKIEKYAQEISGKFADLVVLAIGGSSLGTICLQQSLTPLFQNEMKSGKVPKLHVLDNIDPVLLAEFEETIDLEKTLFIVVTKSGGTPETLAQYLYFKKLVIDAGMTEADHFVFVTDPQKGLLREVSNQNPKIVTFEVPADVGGRFSVLTAVGLLPAALLGVDIKKLLGGARKMRDRFLSAKTEENLPFKIATIQYLLEQKGKNINVTYPYAQKLIRFSDWYRQLLAESIGKAKDNQGKTVNVGITPVHALGATDQHSQNQLYMEGPNNKLFIFLAEKNSQRDLKIPFDPAFAKELDYLENVTFAELLKTEMQGTIDAFTQNNRPSITLEVEKIDEENLGELLMLFEGATAFLGEYYNINAFDQPGVELAKVLTKKYLKARQ